MYFEEIDRAIESFWLLGMARALGRASARSRHRLEWQVHLEWFWEQIASIEPAPSGAPSIQPSVAVPAHTR